MKNLRKVFLAIFTVALLGNNAIAQFSTYDKYHFANIALGNNAEHRTYHLATDDEEFTIVTDGYKISKIDMASNVDFCISFKLDFTHDFIPIDITRVNDKIILLGHYQVSAEEEYYSLISLNYDGTANWEHLYDSEYDKVIQSVNGEIMLAGIDESGLYRLTEVEFLTGIVMQFNSFDMQYIWDEAYSSIPLINLETIELIEDGYYAIGSALSWGRRTVTIKTVAPSMTTTAKSHNVINYNFRIYDLEPDGMGNFYFLGNQANGLNIVMGVMDANHNIFWSEVYSWDPDRFHIYLNRNNHILQRAINTNVLDYWNPNSFTAAMRVIELDRINSGNVGVLQINDSGTILGAKYYYNEQSFNNESIHKSIENQLLLYSSEWKGGAGNSAISRATLTDYLDNCNQIDIDFEKEYVEPTTGIVNVTEVYSPHDEADNDYIGYEYVFDPYIVCSSDDDRSSGTSTIDETNKSNQISIYPNPATDIVVINLGTANATVEILDITGRLVTFEKEYQNNILTVKGLNTGTYLVVIKTVNKTITKKLVIQ